LSSPLSHSSLGRNSVGDFPTGKIDVDRIDWLSPHSARGDNKEWSDEFNQQKKEIVRAYNEEITENSRRFKEMKTGNDIDVLVPCGQLIEDVRNTFDVFVTGVYPTRTFKRRRTKTSGR
jgi:hypothetical protein